MIIQLTCHSCKKVTDFTDRVGLRDECQHCHADAHVCLNCQHYDPKAYNECRESSADRLQTKDRANYCDYFVARTGGAESQISQQQALLNAAEALFKKKS